MLVSLLTFIIGRTTLTGYVPAVKKTRKSKKGNLKRYKKGPEGQLQIGEGSVYSVWAGFDNFLVNLTKLEFLSLLPFIIK